MTTTTATATATGTATATAPSAWTRDRRRHTPIARLSRLTYPARSTVSSSFTSFLSGFPCNIIGHRWVEVPEILRRSLYRGRVTQGRLRFRCSWCSMTGGF